MTRSTLQLLLATLSCIALVAGCTGGSSGYDDDDDAGDDDDDGGTLVLTDGTYVGEGSVQNSNNCGFTGTLDGLSLGVTVVGTSVTFSNGMVLTRTGDALAGSASGTAMLGGSCTVDASITDTGVVTSNDAFHLQEVSDLSNPVGAGCSTFTFPCTTDIEADFVKQ